MEGCCSQCSGCAGRCDLTRALRSRAGEGSETEVIELPRSMASEACRADQQVMLVVEEAALRVEAWWAYGVPSLGLLAGATLAALWLDPTHRWLNEAVLACSVLGTLVALRISKRHSGRALLRALSVLEPRQ